MTKLRTDSLRALQSDIANKLSPRASSASKAGRGGGSGAGVASSPSFSRLGSRQARGIEKRYSSSPRRRTGCGRRRTVRPMRARVARWCPQCVPRRRDHTIRPAEGGRRAAARHAARRRADERRVRRGLVRCMGCGVDLARRSRPPLKARSRVTRSAIRTPTTQRAAGCSCTASGWAARATSRSCCARGLAHQGESQRSLERP